MQVPAGVQDYCTTYADCKAKYPDAMSKWDAFFQVLKHTDIHWYIYTQFLFTSYYPAILKGNWTCIILALVENITF